MIEIDICRMMECYGASEMNMQKGVVAIRFPGESKDLPVTFSVVDSPTRNSYLLLIDSRYERSSKGFAGDGRCRHGG